MSRYPKQEEDPLKKQLRILVHDWNTYLESAPRHRRSRSANNGLLREDEDEILGLSLLNNSPKKLLSSLQQCHSPCSIERRAAARAGRVIEGRSLLEALERVRDYDVCSNASPVCSVCSSVLIQEERSRSCLCSCSMSSMSSFQGSDSSSSLTSLYRWEEAGEEGRRRSKEKKWVARTIWVFVAGWTAAMGVILAMVGFWREDEYGECITPT